ncbi:Uncharacterized protein GBIM_04136, partial [Gryllus bimaculatus]
MDTQLKINTRVNDCMRNFKAIKEKNKEENKCFSSSVSCDEQLSLNEQKDKTMSEKCYDKAMVTFQPNKVLQTWKFYRLFRGKELVMKYLRGENPFNFWLKYPSVNKELEAFLNDFQSKQIENKFWTIDKIPEEGELFIGKLNGSFRGQVLRFQDSKITALDIDKGIVKVVKRNNIWNSDTGFNIPPQAIQCKLYKLRNMKNWPKFMNNLFKKWAKKCILLVTIIDIIPGIIPVFLVDINARDNNTMEINISSWINTNVAPIMKKNNHLKSDHEKKENFLKNSDPCYSQNTNSVESCEPQECQIQAKRATTEVSESQGINAKMCLCSEMIANMTYNITPNSTQKTAKVQCCLNQGLCAKMYFISGIHPWNFYLSHVSRKEMEDMRVTLAMNFPNLRLFPRKPDVGTFAIGKVKNDFCRVEIIGFKTLSGREYAIARNIDNGDMNFFLPDNLYMMNDNLSFIPAMAVKCHLWNITKWPFHWDARIANLFLNIMTKDSLIVSVMKIEYIAGEWNHTVQIKALSKLVFDMSAWIMLYVQPCMTRILGLSEEEQVEEISKLDPSNIFQESSAIKEKFALLWNSYDHK